MRSFWRGCAAAALTAVVLAVVGCAPRNRIEIAAPPAPLPVPVPPGPFEVASPPLAADGAYRTVNHGLGPQAALWHVRSALNVAALGCRGSAEATTIAAYNRFLSTHKAPLDSAYKAVRAEERRAQGARGEQSYDLRMTRVYNFFAQPFAKQDFCTVAEQVLREVNALPDAGLEAYATAALPRLEAPFTDYYRAYDGYRRDLAAWEAGRAATPPLLAYGPIDDLLAWPGPERYAGAADQAGTATSRTAAP